MSINYYYKVSQNFVSDYISWFSTLIPPLVYPYIDMRFVLIEPATRDFSKNLPLLTLEIDIDDSILRFKRQVVTITENLSTIGGLIGSVVVLLRIVLSPI